MPGVWQEWVSECEEHSTVGKPLVRGDVRRDNQGKKGWLYNWMEIVTRELVGGGIREANPGQNPQGSEGIAKTGRRWETVNGVVGGI